MCLEEVFMTILSGVVKNGMCNCCGCVHCVVFARLIQASRTCEGKVLPLQSAFTPHSSEV